MLSLPSQCTTEQFCAVETGVAVCKPLCTADTCANIAGTVCKTRVRASGVGREAYCELVPVSSTGSAPGPAFECGTLTTCDTCLTPNPYNTLCEFVPPSGANAQGYCRKQGTVASGGGIKDKALCAAPDPCNGVSCGEGKRCTPKTDGTCTPFLPLSLVGASC